jgi:hypothetical protein
MKTSFAWAAEQEEGTRQTWSAAWAVVVERVEAEQISFVRTSVHRGPAGAQRDWNWQFFERVLEEEDSERVLRHSFVT